MLIVGLAIVVGVSVWLGVIDWREHLLPDRLTRPLTAFVIVWLLVLGVVTNDVLRSVQALGWGLGAFVVFLALSLAGMGGGDVKFAAPLGATLGWFGWNSISAAIFGLAISAMAVVVVALAQGKGTKHRVAFGPAMVVGLLCGIVVGLVG